MSTVSDDKWEGAAWYWTISRLHYVAVCNEYILGIRVCIFASHPCACRLCIYGCKWGARGTCYVCCRSCLMFVVSMLRWPHRAIVPDLHLYRHRTLSSVINYLSRAYLNLSDCVMHIWPIPMLYNDIPHYISECDPPRTYTHQHMYFVRIDPQFKASR